MVLIGTNDDAAALAALLREHRELGLTVVGAFGEEGDADRMRATRLGRVRMWRYVSARPARSLLDQPQFSPWQPGIKRLVDVVGARVAVFYRATACRCSSCHQSWVAATGKCAARFHEPSRPRPALHDEQGVWWVLNQTGAHATGHRRLVADGGASQPLVWAVSALGHVLRWELTHWLDLSILLATFTSVLMRAFRFVLPRGRAEPKVWTEWTPRVLRLMLRLPGSGTERQLAGMLRAASPVRFSGFSDSPSAVADYLHSRDALVMPWRFKGLPNAVLEAMACEVPVIATVVPGIRAATRGSATIVPTEDAALAGAITALSTTTSHAHTLQCSPRPPSFQTVDRKATAWMHL